MKQKSGPGKAPAEQVLKDIRRQTRRQYSAEEKIRIVLEGLRGEENISELCRREGIAASMYYGWSVEASDRSCFLQIGETKYGKPILDRALTAQSPLDEAAKLALLSFDATMRSNLSVGFPIDMLIYRTGSFLTAKIVTVEDDNPYW